MRGWAWVGWLGCALAWGGEPVPASTEGLSVPSVPALKVVERPLPFPPERTAATVAYRAAHTGDGVASAEIVPRVVVLHWTGGGSAEAAWQTFAPPTLAGRADVGRGGDLNVSAHFLVDRDGTVTRLMPETTMARHCIGLNHVAVGIENVGDGGAFPLTEAQVVANAAIVRQLAAVHPVTHVIGHHAYRSMEGHPYFREADPTYRTVKVDPGDAFVRAVLDRVADLGLQGAPAGP